MIKIMMMLLMPLLISSKCTRTDVKLTCAQVRSAKIKSLPYCDISFKKNRCRCRCFNLTSYKVVDDIQCGEDFKTGNYELETCEGVGGFLVEEWAKDVRPNIKKLQNLYGNLCRR